jgi:hypothetical protein
VRTASVKGKRVRALIQHRDSDAHVRPCVELDAIVFEDGSEIRFCVHEGDVEYHVQGIYVPAPWRSCE